MPLGMNKQDPGIEWTHPPISKENPAPRPGYTWNVLGGCIHDCEWEMPDGQIASCYAKDTAEGVASAAYPQGFKVVYWHPERLASPAKLAEPAGIFLDSMSDLLAHNIGDDKVEAVLDVVKDNPQHIFFLLTKNAPRLQRVAEERKLPSNLWAGVSMPPTFMFGRRLDSEQQKAYVKRALAALEAVGKTGFKGVRWMSFEPLSFEVTTRLMDHHTTYDHLPLEWAVIGAASAGKTKYQPDANHLRNLVKMLTIENVPIFFKGNMRGNPVAEPWREEYPVQ